MPMKDRDHQEERMANLFGSTSRPRILSLLLSHPQQAFYQREIMYETGLSLQTVQRELQNLLRLGILKKRDYSYKLKITPEGEFQTYYGKGYIGIPSPIEQNKRHIHLLDLFLKHHDILPRRVGISIRPRFKNLLLVSPKSIIVRPLKKKFDTGFVIKADTLRTKIDRELEKWNPLANFATISKICSSATLKEAARTLAGFHKPKRIDFRAKFAVLVKRT